MSPCGSPPRRDHAHIRQTHGEDRINSNGELMKEEAREPDAGIDIIRFSIDGFSAETFGRASDSITSRSSARACRAGARARQHRAHRGRMISMDYNRHEQEASWSSGRAPERPRW
jgi:hypothetical protein